MCTPSHPSRAQRGLLGEAMHSVYMQTLLPDAVSLAVDTTGAGAAATRQRALEAVQTEWVAFLDSDDMFMSRHLELMLKHAQETEADFVYSWFKILLQYPDGRKEVLEDDPIFPLGHYLNPFDGSREDTVIETTVTTFVKTELAKQIGFQELNRGESNSGEDRYFTLEAWRAGANISHLIRKTWYWRHHQGNTSGRPFKGDAVQIS